MKVNLKELGFDVVKPSSVAFGALDHLPSCNHENLEDVKIQYVAYDSDEHSIVLKVKCCKCYSDLNIFGISFREMSNLIVQKLNLSDFISQRVMAKAFEEGQKETIQCLVYREIEQIKASICNPLVPPKAEINENTINSLRRRLEELDRLENIYSMFSEIISNIENQDEEQKEAMN